MAIATYYFDGHSGISDPDNVWSNDANAANGSTSNSALLGSYTIHSGASNTSRELILKGATASAVADTEVTLVSARAYTSDSAGNFMNTEIFTSGGVGVGESLGTIIKTATGSGWSDYLALTAPTGGWSWSVVPDLWSISWFNGSVGPVPPAVSMVEIKVTYSTISTSSGNMLMMFM